MPTDPLPALLTIKQAAERLAVSKQTVYRLFHAGELRGARIRAAIRIAADSVAAYLAANANAAPSPAAADLKPSGPAARRPGRRAARPTGFLFVPR